MSPFGTGRDKGEEGRVETGAAGVGVLAAETCTSTVSLVSSIRITDPSETLSPTFTFISFTTPAAGLGISIAALSVSSVTRDCSFSILSPTFTAISMMAISLKSPMSGTLTSIVWLMLFSQGVLIRHSRPRILLSGEAGIQYLISYLSATQYDVFLRSQAFQSDRATRMNLVGGNAD